MKRKSNTLRMIVLFFCFLFVSLGVLKNWREFNYRRACIAMKAKVIDADITVASGKGMASAHYKVTYLHDAKVDTLTVFSSIELSTKQPPPSIEELKSHSVFVHYVPLRNRAKTSLYDRITTTTDGVLDASFYSGWFNFALLLLLFSYLAKPSMFRTKAR